MCQFTPRFVLPTLLAAACLVAGQTPASAAFIGGSAEITITHDSGFNDANGDPIVRSQTWDVADLTTEESFPTYSFPQQSLTDPASAGSSSAQGLTALRIDMEDERVWARIHPSRFEVNQDNPAGTALRPASLRFDYSTDVTYGEVWGRPQGPRQFMGVSGFIGDGTGAYIQFEAVETITARDADGNVIESVTSSVGGPELLSAEHDVVSGGGRIDRTVDSDGEVEIFRLLNYGSHTETPYSPPADFFPPPRLRPDEDYATLEINGYYEVLAKNDGSPSGIAVSGVPEPASAALVGLGALMLLPRRRRRAHTSVH